MTFLPRFIFQFFVMFFSAILFLGVTSKVQAQQVQIAVVDVEKILSTSLAGKSVENQLKNRREAFQKEFAAREDSLMQSQKSLIEKKNDLTAEEFSSKRQSFENQLLETQKLFKKRRHSLDRGLSGALGQLRKHIIAVTAEVANERNFQVVLTRDSVVIVEKEMDITETVLKRLNAKVSTIPLGVE